MTPPTDTIPMITISLEIENTYEDGQEIITRVTGAEIPAPPSSPTDGGGDALADWANEHIHDFTGTGRTEGDAWYDVVVTACSDPSLVGKTFAFGY